MKKFYLIALLCGGTLTAQNIVFVDTVFKNELLGSTAFNSTADDINGNAIQIDANNDNEISYAEAALVYGIKIQGQNITNVTGIEYFINLTTLDLKNNGFATIDVSTMPNLLSLEVSNNTSLISVYAKNGSNESIFFGINNPNLTYICSDENQLALLADSNSTLLPNYLVNSYCSVAPAGNHNTITGQIGYDSDNNSTTPNSLNPYLKMVSTIAGTTYQTVSKADGNFSTYTLSTGNFTLTPQIENAAWFTFTPETGSFPDNLNNVDVNNFSIIPNGIHHDVEISIRPIKEPLGGVSLAVVPYEIVFKNKGTQIESGTVTVTYDNSLLSFINATAPVTPLNGTITHNYANLLPFETRAFNVTLNSINPLTTGSNLVTALAIDNTAGELASTQGDNVFTYQQTVVNGSNANTVACLEGDTVSASQIGDYLHYAINFTNQGSQPAANVTIKTVFDAAKFDTNSIQILNATHPLDLEIINNTALYKLRASGIGGPGGQGGILLKIATNSSLASGSSVDCSADIFFEYSPLITPDLALSNNAITTFESLNVTISHFDDAISVYPNPAQSEISVSSANRDVISSVELYDISGKLLQTRINATPEANIDISQRAAGIYFLKITTDKGQKVHKIIKN